MMEEINATSHSVTKQPLSEQEKRDYYKAWKSSGMPKTDFCKKHGLSTNQLYYWHQLYKTESVTRSKLFSPVVSKTESSNPQQNMSTFELRLPNQTQLFITLH